MPVRTVAHKTKYCHHLQHSGVMEVAVGHAAIHRPGNNVIRIDWSKIIGISNT